MAKNNKMPAIRFSGYTDTWEQRKLGALAEIVRGASPRPISDPKWFDNDSSVGWLRIADVTAQDGRIRYLEQKISELGQEKTRVIKTPHLLLSIAATVGKPVINYVPTGVHDGFLIFLNPKFNILYAFWWLEMFREKWNKYGQPGSQVNLNSDLVKNQVINIPNEKEQEKISSFLESLDKIISLHQRKLEKLKLAKKALLQKLFPKNGSQFPEIRFKGFTDAWEQRKLDELTISIGDGLHGTPKYDENGSYYFINGNNLVDSKVSVTAETKKVAFEALSNDDRRLDSTSILMSINGTIGTLARYNNENIMLGKSVAYITPKNINRDFLFYQLQGNVIQSYFYKNLTGTTIKNLGLGTIKNAIVMSTLSEEESKIGQFFYKLDQYITLHQCKLEMLKNVKKGLLQKMFV